MAPLASSQAPAPTKQQPIWKLKRKNRRERIPQNFLIITAAFVCLFSVQNLFDVFGGGTKAGLPGRQQSLDLAREHAGLGPYSSADWATHRRLSTISAESYLNESCLPEPNSSSVLPPFDVEPEPWDPAAAQIFCIIITLYMFLGLAIVCDSFFEASLSAICEAMNLKDDVAGATWMAAGGSAPELATSIIGVFFSRSDVGFGTIVGSAVFNVLFVIACCAFVAPNLKLTWWPLARDAAYYCFALALIVIFVTDLKVEHWEAIILLLAYGGYVTIMYYNEKLEEWVTARIEKNKLPGSALQEGAKKMIEHWLFAAALYAVIAANAVVVIAEIHEFNTRAGELPCKCGVQIGASTLPNTALYWINFGFNMFFIAEMVGKIWAYGFFGYWRIPLNCFDGSLVFLIVVELILTASAESTARKIAAQQDAAIEDLDANDSIGVGVARLLRLLKFVRFVRLSRALRLFRPVLAMVGMSMKDSSTSTVTPSADAEGKSVEAKPAVKDVEGKAEGGEGEGEGGGDDDDDDDDDGPFDPFEMWGDFESPGGIFGRCMWFIGLPLSVGFWATIPDCRRPMFEKFWAGTFFACITWIAILATFMVWMVERLGVRWGIPESVMGVFILAAGTSIPDCLSSIAVARRGHGDMAVSSSIGSNIFDVLIGLPVPWFIYTAILYPAAGDSVGETPYVPVQSEALAVMILLLFVMVALVITTVHLSGWILSIRLGMAMMGLYFIFLIFALLLDPNVFGDSSPVIFPDCTPDP